ncbi:MAG: ATP-dependent DNA helicase, partial [Prevotella sp.]|nr:ATP-dependent DNA helicase [Prevotella sp.]
RPERPVDPFSDDFKRKLASASGKFRKLDSVSRPNTLNQPSALKSLETPSDSPLKPGKVIEHQRFGIGTVVMVEGSGENTKATVDFRNVGTKQLLLKFARYTIIKS